MLVAAAGGGSGCCYSHFDWKSKSAAIVAVGV